MDVCRLTIYVALARVRTHVSFQCVASNCVQCADDGANGDDDDVGTCGGFFTYYYQTGSLNCDCNKAVGDYEWVYQNLQPDVATQVGQDYGGSFDNIVGHGAWVRQKACAGYALHHLIRSHCCVVC